jgi:CxxC motif-containing protein
MAKRSLTCIVCPVGCKIDVEMGDGVIIGIEGNLCERGISYAKEECTSPKRVLTTLVRVKGGVLPVTSVKTTRPISKALVAAVHKELSGVVLEAPLEVGETVLSNVLDAGADVVVTRRAERREGSTSHFQR